MAHLFRVARKASENEWPHPPQSRISAFPSSGSPLCVPLTRAVCRCCIKNSYGQETKQIKINIPNFRCQVGILHRAIDFACRDGALPPPVLHFSTAPCRSRCRAQLFATKERYRCGLPLAGTHRPLRQYKFAEGYCVSDAHSAHYGCVSRYCARMPAAQAQSFGQGRFL